MRFFNEIRALVFFFCLLFCSIHVAGQPEVCPQVNADMTPTCAEACIICDIDGYTGTHSSNVNGELPNDFCTFFVHNAQWIAFQAASENLTIELTVSNCDLGVGLEMAIYESLDCENFEMVSNCLGGMGGIVGEGETGVFVNTVPLVVGQYYYLAMDGGMGDNCDWTLNVVQGSTQLAPLATAGEIMGDTTICINTQETYSVEPTLGVTKYEWFVNGVLVDAMANPSITYNFPAIGEYEICVVASNVCSTSPPSCKMIQVGQETQIQIRDSICMGQVYAFNGAQLSSSGIYPAVLTSTLGCDSTVLLNLFVKPIIRDSSYFTLCTGDTINTPLQAIWQSGTFTDTLTMAKGCDSLAYYIIEEVSQITNLQKIELCQGDTLFTRQHVITTSGIYIDSLSTIRNCDSIVIYDLTIINTKVTSIPISNCEKDPFVLNGVSYTRDTSFSELLTTKMGCDSIVNYNLSFRKQTASTTHLKLCEGDTIMLNNIAIDVPGVFKDTLVNGQGCDSIITFMVTLKDKEKSTVSISNCAYDPFVLNGISYTRDTSFNLLLTTAQGCDSIVTYNVSYKPLTKDTLAIEICKGDKVVVNSLVLDAEGVYLDTLINVQGCDSVLTIFVMEKNCMIDGSLWADDIDCRGDSTGLIYVHVHTGALPIIARVENTSGILVGLDSIVAYTDTLVFKNLNAGIYNITMTDQNGEQFKNQVTIAEGSALSMVAATSDYNGYGVSCHGYNDGFISLSISGGKPPYKVTWISGSNDFELSQLYAGDYTVVIRDSLGCELAKNIQLTEPTTLTLDLQIADASCDNSANINVVTIVGGVPPYTQIVNGNTISEIDGPPTLAPGQYTFTILDNNDCMIDDNFNLTEAIECDIYLPNVLSLNNDGVNDYFGIFLSNNFSGSFQSLKIYDRWGNLVFTLSDFAPNQTLWDGRFQNKLVEQGVYTYMIEYTVTAVGKKVISGDVTVVR
jgi:gliding motility-associated-like protein